MVFKNYNQKNLRWPSLQISIHLIHIMDSPQFLR